MGMAARTSTRWMLKPLAACILSVCAGQSLAQSVEEDDMALVFGEKSTISIATGRAQPIARAPSVASVITAEEIRNMGAKDIDDVLVTVPGLYVSKSELTSSSKYVMRGMTTKYNPQILMLMNGVPMTSIFVGNRTDIGTSIPVENISRIEVIRGPGSALYGADAFSGVINIITKNAKEIGGTRYGMGIGSFNTQDLWTQYGGTLNDVEVATYVRVGSTDGQHRTVEADAQTYLDHAFGTSASLAPGAIHEGYKAVDAQLDLRYSHWQFRAGYRLRDDVQMGVGVVDALDPVGRGRSERFTSDLVWHDADFAQNWDVSAQASFMDQANEITTPLQLYPAGASFAAIGGGTFPNGMLGAPSKWERALRSSLSAAYSGWQDHQLRFGIGHDVLQMYRIREIKNFVILPTSVPSYLGSMQDMSSSQPFLKTGTRNVSYFYAQDEWNFVQDWTLTAGLRHDHYSDFGGTTNPRLALVWDTAQNVTTKFMAGRAFRAPSWVEMYSINNPAAMGNPNLRPETVGTYEAAVSWKARPDLELNANVYRYQWNDVINFVTIGTTTVAQNTGKQNGRGLELEAVWDTMPDLRLRGSVAFQHSIDETTQQDAGLAPHRRYFGQATWRVAPFWVLDTSLNRVEDRRRQPGDTRQNIANYTRVDLALRRERLFGSWEGRATVANLFNADIREPSILPQTNLPNDLPMPGRTWYLHLVHSLD